MFASALVFVILNALPSPAFGVVALPADPDPVSRLEDRLRSTYMTLPRDGEGLPDSSGVRYLARRYLEAEHGWAVKGLDMAPWLRDGHNASQVAARRASELLASPAATSGPLLTALSLEPGRGFTLRETAEAVHAIEAFVASHDAALMRRARAMSKWAHFFRGGKHVDDRMQNALTFYAVLTYTQDADMLTKELGRELYDQAMKELSEWPVDFSAGRGVSLQVAVAEAAKKATVGSPSSRARMYSGMHHLRNRLRERHTLGFCQRTRGVLSSMDHQGSGQVEYRHLYAIKVHNWQFLETPEYLRAVGAYAEEGAKGGGPGVLIPNYVSGINNCDAPSVHPTLFCCPDECEAEILPRLEAAAAGPRIAPKQAWAALSRLIKGNKMFAADKRKELHSQLLALALRSGDGLVEVHGQRLGRWLHRAFPHKCRMPVAHGSPAVVDPALLPAAWMSAGKYLPMNEPEVEEVRAHLQARWGPDGTGADPRSFAARSAMGLDQELQLVQKLQSQHESGGPPVKQALEDALNVRVLDRSPHAEDLLAAVLAAVLLGLLAAAAAPMGHFAAEACSFLAAAAAATRRFRSAEPAAACECGARAALGREGPRLACEVSPVESVKDGSTDAGDTDSEATGELSAGDSDSEREPATVFVEAGRVCADVGDGNPSQREAATEAEAEEEEEADPQDAPGAAEVLPPAEAAGAGRLPRPAVFPRGFGPPPGLEPPPGLQLTLEALGLEPDWHRLGTYQSQPNPQHTVLERRSAEEHPWQASPDGARLMSVVCRQLKQG